MLKKLGRKFLQKREIVGENLLRKVNEKSMDVEGN